MKGLDLLSPHPDRRGRPPGLHEYCTATLPLTNTAARELDEISSGRLMIGFGSEAGTFTITASSHAGTVVTRDVEVFIRPKLSMENLFMLLDVGLPAGSWSHDGAPSVVECSVEELADWVEARSLVGAP